MSAIFLPAIMDRAALGPLARDMSDQCDRGEALVMDGSKVSRIGLAGLQLLTSAALAAREKDVAFEITEPSDELAGAAELSGLCGLFGMAA